MSVEAARLASCLSWSAGLSSRFLMVAGGFGPGQTEAMLTMPLSVSTPQEISSSRE